MAPRILSWEEKIDEVMFEITRIKLEIRLHTKKDQRLHNLRMYKRDMVLQFHLKIESNLEKNQDEVRPENEWYNQEIINLSIEINQISEEIEAMSEK